MKKTTLSLMALLLFAAGVVAVANMHDRQLRKIELRTALHDIRFANMQLARPGGVSSPTLSATVTVFGERGSGSGVLVAPGVVLTAVHVAKDAISVRWADERVVLVDAIFVDTDDDLALLLVDPNSCDGFVPIRWDDPDTGSQVYAVGSPLFLTDIVTYGIISSDRTEIDRWRPCRLLNVTIYPGNSGGGVFLDNALVGIIVGKLRAMPEIAVMVPVGRLDNDLKEIIYGRL